MEKSTKEGYIASGAVLVVGILLSVTGIKQGLVLDNLVLITGAILDLLGIFGLFKPDTVGSVLSHWLDNVAKNQQNQQDMDRSPGAKQVNAGRDVHIVETARSSPNRQERNEAEEWGALIKIRSKMNSALRIINDAANLGVRDETKFNEAKKALEEFVETKMEYDILLDKEMIIGFNEAMGAFRKTIAELHKNLLSKQLNDSIKGSEFYTFVDKCKEADALIRERLNKKD